MSENKVPAVVELKVRTLERENAELHADIAHLRHCAKLQDSATAAVMERAEKAEAELAALREDAKRYRWLRDGDAVWRYRWLQDGDVVCGTDFPAAKDRAGNSLWLQELDAAIDAARKEGA